MTDDLTDPIPTAEISFTPKILYEAYRSSQLTNDRAIEQVWEELDDVEKAAWVDVVRAAVKRIRL